MFKLKNGLLLDLEQLSLTIFRQIAWQWEFLQKSFEQRLTGVFKMKHINEKRIYLSSPHMSGNEQKYIKDAFDTNWIAPLGPNVDAFEKELASYVGVKD